MITLIETHREHVAESIATSVAVLDLLTRSFPNIAPELTELKSHAEQSLAYLGASVPAQQEGDNAQTN